MSNNQSEYAQTYQHRSTEPLKPAALTPPDGDGWALHSWAQCMKHNTSLIVVWQRPLELSKNA